MFERHGGSKQNKNFAELAENLKISEKESTIGNILISADIEGKKLLIRLFDPNDRDNKFIQLYCTENYMEFGRSYNGSWQSIWTK